MALCRFPNQFRHGLDLSQAARQINQLPDKIMNDPSKYKSEREQRGTQSEVAALLGVNRVSIARRETGAQVITVEAWKALLSLPKKSKRK